MHKHGAVAAAVMTLFVAGCTGSAQTTSPNKTTTSLPKTIPPGGNYTTTTVPSRTTISIPTLSNTTLPPTITI
jgi:hypothetical protein